MLLVSLVRVYNQISRAELAPIKAKTGRHVENVVPVLG